MKPGRPRLLQKRKVGKLRSADVEDSEEDSQSATELPHRGRPRKNLRQQHQRSLLLTSSPSKQERRQKREQKTVATTTEQQNQQLHAESYVMKLFDRSLDLSKYTEDTSLYPICRAWMLNQPRDAHIPTFRNAKSPTRSQRQDNGAELLAKLRRNELREISAMPSPKSIDVPVMSKPEKKPKAEVAEIIDKLDAILEKSGIPKRENDILATDSDEDKKNEVLLANHITQWKRTKASLRQRAKSIPQRYELSARILDALYKDKA